MGLRLESVTIAYGSRLAVDGVDVDVPTGQVLALLGPSGCGKSTLLRAVAGLEPLQSGAVYFDGADLARTPVHRRGFGLMFQDGVLFPHRTVAGNIAYGLQTGRRKHTTKAAVAERVAGLLDLVGLPGYGSRRVASLSGGEQQRVALARALAPEPALLLLDEPLAALDASLRERLLTDLRRILRSTGTTAVFVTHDQTEAFAIGDQVAVMNEGRVQQTGSLREVWSRPASEWVARFLGYTSVIPDPDPDPDPDSGRQARRRRLLALRPAALQVDPEGQISGVVAAVSPRPEYLLLTVAVDGWGSMTAVSDSATEPGVGQTLRLRLDRRHTAPISDAGEL